MLMKVIFKQQFQQIKEIINKISQQKQNGKRAFRGFHLKALIQILHDHKILHRDIKSTNILFFHGIARLGDLNVSAITDSSFYSTNTETPYYSAAQIWKGQKYKKNCNIWSFGCIIYEMCTLLPTFRVELQRVNILPYHNIFLKI